MQNGAISKHVQGWLYLWVVITRYCVFLQAPDPVAKFELVIQLLLLATTTRQRILLLPNMADHLIPHTASRGFLCVEDVASDMAELAARSDLDHMIIYR